MSIYAMTLVYQSGLNKSQKAIALAYADHAHDDGTNIYPSVDYVAWKTGYSDRSVQTITQELVDLGILILYKNGGNGPGSTNKYRMDFSKLPERPPFRDKKGEDISPSMGEIHAEKGEIDDKKGEIHAEKGEATSPKPSYNHQEESSNNRNGADAAAVANADKQSVVRIYENEIGSTSPHIVEQINAAVEEFGSNLITQAMQIAVANNVRTWAYVRGILDRWRVEGRHAPAKPPPKRKPEKLIILDDNGQPLREVMVNV